MKRIAIAKTQIDTDFLELVNKNPFLSASLRSKSVSSAC